MVNDTYDPSVDELARHFLQDEHLSDEVYEKCVKSLSIAIQNEIEGWLQDLHERMEQEQ